MKTVRSFEQTQTIELDSSSNNMDQKEKDLKASTLLRMLKDFMKDDVFREIKRSLSKN